MGLKIVEAMVGENPLTHTIKKKDLAIQIPSKSVIKVAEFSMGTYVDPQLLFQRALNFASSGVVNTTLEECLRYEICPISMSLFDENGYMRSAYSN